MKLRPYFKASLAAKETALAAAEQAAGAVREKQATAAATAAGASASPLGWLTGLFTSYRAPGLSKADASLANQSLFFDASLGMSARLSLIIEQRRSVLAAADNFDKSAIESEITALTVGRCRLTPT